MAMHNTEDGIETNYNVDFRNCERKDYEMMYNESVQVSEDISKQNDTLIATKLCPKFNDNPEFLSKMYL